MGVELVQVEAGHADSLGGSGRTAKILRLDSAATLATGLTKDDVAIETLGRCTLPSSLAEQLGHKAMRFAGAADKVLVDDCISQLGERVDDVSQLAAFELAGPRHKIFFDPRTTRAGIVTCGGLCPGLNNVVRGIVLELANGYGIKRILGFRYGFEGIIARFNHEPLVLTPALVENIHHQGGTILGSSRGSQDPAEVVDNLEAMGIDVLFVVGGDGTLRGAIDIAEEVARRGLRLAVVGVPKTIDNDLQFIDRSFGFESAFSAAVEVIRSARVEAMGAHNGIGLVKLMGRHSGFVACHAALASADVDLVLIPEVNATLEGPAGVLDCIERILAKHGHAVIVVAEGAAQDLVDPEPRGPETDRSGNAKLRDVGVFMRDRIVEHFAKLGRDVTLKYIDPSYTIRSVPASAADSVYCWNMARNAVHAAMAGNTKMLIGRWHGRFVHVPMHLAIRARKRVDPTDELWTSVIEATGQPRLFG